MNNNTRIVSLALAGLAAGGSIWYLFGTKQGKQLRHDLADSAKGLGDDIKERVSDKLYDASKKAGKWAKNISK